VRDPRSVDVADVYKGDRLAGRLRRDGPQVLFTYDRAYLADPGPPIGFNLPLRQDPYVATGGSVPPFFAGLLPEGARLVALVERIGTSPDDMLSLLLTVGGDTIGDVRVVEEGAEPVGAPPLMSGRPEDTDFDDLFAASIGMSRDRFERSALPGAQEKVSASMLSVPVSSPTAPHILKLTPPRFPRLVENEYFFMGVARSCGITTADVKLVHDRNGQSGLLVTRFDRVMKRGRVIRRLAQEDGCQLCDAYPADKYRLTALTVAAILELIKLIAFSWVIANNDMHAKNFSVRVETDGIVAPTPAYDLLSTLPYGDRTMALEIEGRRNKLRSEDFVSFAKRTGVGERAVKRSLAQIGEATRDALDRLDTVGFDPRIECRLRDEITTRLTTIHATR